MNRDELLQAVVGYIEEGVFPPHQAITALKALARTSSEPPSGSAILEALMAEDDPDLRKLADLLDKALLKDAKTAHDFRSTGRRIPDAVRRRLSDLPLEVPLGWESEEHSEERINRALHLLRDRCGILPLKGAWSSTRIRAIG